MTKRHFSTLAAALAIVFSANATAFQLDLFARKAGRSLPEAVGAKETKFPGVWEVSLSDGGIVYTNSSADFVMIGALVDLSTKENLTKSALQEAAAFSWGKLPWNGAVSFGPKNPKFKVAVFSDPDCPHCKALDRDLSAMGDVETNVFPISVQGRASEAKIIALFCHDAPKTQWSAMMGETWAGPNAFCEKGQRAYDKNTAVAGKLGISASPTMILPNGKKFTGRLSGANLRQFIESGADGK